MIRYVSAEPGLGMEDGGEELSVSCLWDSQALTLYKAADGYPILVFEGERPESYQLESKSNNSY